MIAMRIIHLVEIITLIAVGGNYRKYTAVVAKSKSFDMFFFLRVIFLSFYRLIFSARGDSMFCMKFNFKRTFYCSLAFGWIALFWGSYDAIMQSIDYDVFGLSSVWHGVIIAADNILGLLLLPLFGKLSDKTNSRFGKRTPYIVGGTIISMIGFAGVCIFASLGKAYFVPFLISLIITLSAMAAYRSPALALVPDVNPDKHRSMANAVSNIVSVVTTVIAMLYFYLFMGDGNYYMVGGAFIITTLIMLVWFIFAAREPKFVADMQEEMRVAEEKAAADAEQQRINNELISMDEEGADSSNLAFSINHSIDVYSFTEDSLLHLPNFDSALSHEYTKSVKNFHAERKKSLHVNKKKKLRDRPLFNRACILVVVFCFYMAYNALTSNFIKYAEHVLSFKQNEAIIPLILAQLAAMLAFPLAGYLSNKVGRKITIFAGFLLMVSVFAGTIFFSSPTPGLYVMFVLVGVSFGLVMVNIYPFFLETSSSNKIGQDTGIFSFAMTLAMVITPILSGVLIDATSGWYGGGDFDGLSILFPYCCLFLALACVTTLFIKDKRKSKAKTGIESFDVD